MLDQIKATSPLIVRADADSRIGTGHLMRCLALAQFWKTQCGEVTFITCCEGSGLRERLSNAGMQE